MMTIAVPKLLPGTVHLWRVNLDQFAGLGEILSRDELERAARFRFDRDRIRYVAGRSALRFLLGGYLKRNPGDLVFSYGPAGKPSLSEISFNLAHSGAHGLIGVAAEKLIGVDIEEVRALPDLDDVARTVFAPGELVRWRGLDSRDRVSAFYRIWTRKEAYLKAMGEGIAHRLQKFEVAFEPNESERIISGAEGVWSLHDVSPSEDLIAAVAYEGSAVGIETFPLECV
jgi:4'-phosphopantetheinyl transferase